MSLPNPLKKKILILMRVRSKNFFWEQLPVSKIAVVWNYQYEINILLCHKTLFILLMKHTHTYVCCFMLQFSWVAAAGYCCPHWIILPHVFIIASVCVFFLLFRFVIFLNWWCLFLDPKCVLFTNEYHVPASFSFHDAAAALFFVMS